ncbi:MAG: holo-[acyl-carrier-protein] synthase [Cytophagaceae bacterium]|nr:MAG: holo-[acyl-carrier-protein] synthase [Cytophagaceae bacterium]
MILGIGTDLVEPARLAEKLGRSPALRAKLFAPAEIAYCEQMADPAQHYAGRFAAKEALLKALGCGLTATFDLHEAAVENDELGAPYFRLAGELQQLVAERGVARTHLSISHIHLVASAFVILEA